MSTEEIITMVKKWKPVGDRIIVQPELRETKTKSGLIATTTKIGEEMRQKGLVLSVGPGRIYESGIRGEMEISVGDTVLFGQHAGDTIYIDQNGEIQRGLGDLREDWVAIRILQQHSILTILSHASS